MNESIRSGWVSARENPARRSLHGIEHGENVREHERHAIGRLLVRLAASTVSTQVE